MTSRRKQNGRPNKIIIAVLSLLIVAAVAFSAVTVAELISRTPTDSTDPQVSSTESVPSEPPPVVKTSTATVAATGDLLMHEPIINHAKQGDGTYNFDNIYTYFSKYASAADYAVANLETTLRGTEDGYEYSGYPQFNCPDSIVDATKAAGFDMLLTANNHSYDTRLNGMLRTLEVVDGSGMDRLGTYKDTSEKRYIVKSVNDINIGMISYTYETDTDADEVALNGISMSDEAKGLVNAFSYGELDTFYTEIDGHIRSMKADGAEAIVLFIHWGDEYNITENKTQNEIAQKLCDLGVDVIVGGHPHVVQPIELLTSTTDPTQKTVCLYSMGNAVSNQRRDRMDLSTGHTEDGVLFSFTFAKYSDGTVVLEDADILPTWVNMYTSAKTGKRVYEIIPLDRSITDWKAAFDFTDTSLSNAEKSYDRTMKIVGEGLADVKAYLADPEGYIAAENADNTSSETDSTESSDTE